jgi:SAM-dependent methyltransferase
VIDDEKLAASSVVANCSMNRDRGLTGRDGYARVLGLDLMDVLASRLATPGPVVRWLDLCCGRGNALLETVSLLRERGLADRLRVVGVDLVSHFADAPPAEVRFVTAPVTEWRPADHVDLITCVHGLHYVGDKLGVLAATASWLTADGELAANFDATGVRSAGGDPLGPRLTKALREAGFDYDGRARRIRRHGQADVRLPFHYLGADDRAGPNYTGQPAVHSHYDPR